MSDVYAKISDLNEELPNYEEENELVAEATLEVEEEPIPKAYNADYEMKLARDIYNRGEVKVAGKTALAKISHVLISYNRMMDSKARVDVQMKKERLLAETEFSEDLKKLFEEFGINAEDFESKKEELEKELAEDAKREQEEAEEEEKEQEEKEQEETEQEETEEKINEQEEEQPEEEEQEDTNKEQKKELEVIEEVAAELEEDHEEPVKGLEVIEEVAAELEEDHEEPVKGLEVIEEVPEELEEDHEEPKKELEVIEEVPEELEEDHEEPKKELEVIEEVAEELEEDHEEDEEEEDDDEITVSPEDELKEELKMRYREAKSKYDYKMEMLQDKADKKIEKDAKNNTNRDEVGGILATLMLGGSAVGSEGFSLTTGDTMDLMTGGKYIEKVASGKGTLFDQMALLDNAVNTNGIELNNEKEVDVRKDVDDAYIGSSIKGAKYSLNDILFKGTDKDIEFINASRYKNEPGTKSIATEKIALDFDAIEAEKNSRKLAEKNKDGSNEKNDKKLTIKEAYEKRKELDVFNRNRDDLNIYSDEINEMLENSVVPLKPIADHSKKTRRSSSKELREARKAWEARMIKVREGRRVHNIKVADYTYNKNDVDYKSIPTLNEEQLKASREAMGKDDKSVKNMIFAYRVMGATPKELYLFRLAIIAYMIPTGKKTLREILTESAEAGYIGNEDLTTDESMYSTFLDAPVIDYNFVNNYGKEDFRKIDRYKKVKLENENPESKEEKEKRLADKWKVDEEFLETDEDEEERDEVEEADENEEVEEQEEVEETDEEAISKSPEEANEEIEKEITEELNGASEEIDLSEEGELGEESEVDEDRKEQGNEIQADIEPKNKLENPVETIIKKFISNGQRQNDDAVKIFKDLSVIIDKKRLEFGLTENDISLLAEHLNDDSKIFKNGLLRIIKKVVEENK